MFMQRQNEPGYIYSAGHLLQKFANLQQLSYCSYNQSKIRPAAYQD